MNSFAKALVWFLFMACLITGIQFALAMKTPLHIFYTVSSFGACWMLSRAFKNLSRKGFFFSITFAIALALAAKGIPHDLVYEYFDIRHALKFHEAWAALNLIIGVPGMTVIFSKFED